MGKAARNKRNRVEGTGTVSDLFGLNSEESRFGRQQRLEAWTTTTPCGRLQQLIDYNEDQISPANIAEVMDRFHAGSVSYRIAVSTLLGHVAVKMMSRHFALCEQRRMRTLDDPLDFMADFMNPSSRSDVEISEEAKYLLVLTFIFHEGRPRREIFPDQNWAEVYRSVIVSAVGFNFRLAANAQQQLNLGRISWEELHGPCEYEHQAAA